MTRNSRPRAASPIACRVARLVREVELLVDGPVELLDDAGRRVDAGLLDHRLEQLREVVEEREVRLDLLPDARPLHLHDDPLAARGSGAVDLGDRRARERPSSSSANSSSTRRPRPALDLARRISADGEGRAVVLERLELLDPVGGQEVRPGGEELPELDEGGPELGQQLPEARRGLAVRRRQGLALRRQARRARAPRASARAREVGAEAVPRHRRRDLAQPVQVLESPREHRSRTVASGRSRRRHDPRRPARAAAAAR